MSKVKRKTKQSVAIVKLFAKAKAAADADCPATAVELFREYLKRKPRHDYARFRYAVELRMLGLLTQAKAHLSRLRYNDTEEKGKFMIALERGQLAVDCGDSKSAERYFRTALNLCPNSTIPYVYLATVLHKQERFEESCKILAAGLNAQADKDELDLDEVLLNLSCDKRALGQFEEAKTHAEAALRLDPKYSEVLKVLKDLKRVLAFKQWRSSRSKSRKKKA